MIKMLVTSQFYGGPSSECMMGAGVRARPGLPKMFPIIWVCVHLLFLNFSLFTRYSPRRNPLLWIRDDLD